MYNYNHLYYFYLIVKFEGVTKAANYLKTSQSSLSTQMKQFEENLDRKLFEKEGRKLALTSEGEIIYSYCKNSFENFEEMGAFLSNKLRAGRKKLRIGVVDEIERPFVSSLISGVVKKDLKNSVAVNLHSACHSDIMEKFMVRDIDVAITSDPILSNGIKFSAVIELPIGIVISSKLVGSLNKETKSYKLFLKDIDFGMALPSPNLKLRKEIDAFLSKNKINRNITYESNVISTIVRSVIDGMVFSFLPLIYVEKELRQGRLVQIEQKANFWMHKLFIYSYSESLLIDIKNEIVNTLNVKIK